MSSRCPLASVDSGQLSPLSALATFAVDRATSQESKKKNPAAVCALLGVVWTNIGPSSDRTWPNENVYTPQLPTFSPGACGALPASSLSSSQPASAQLLLQLFICLLCWPCLEVHQDFQDAATASGVCNFASCVSFFIFGALWVPFGNGNKAEGKPNKVNRQFLKRLMLWVIAEVLRRRTECRVAEWAKCAIRTLHQCLVKHHLTRLCLLPTAFNHKGSERIVGLQESKTRFLAGYR